MSERHNEQLHEQQPAPALRPRVWIASLADYNAGQLHGEWIDAAVDEDVLVAAAERIVASSLERGAEEWAIFDYAEFGSYRVGEYDQLGSVAAVARGIAQHGPAYASWAEQCRDDAERRERFEEAFLGEYSSRDAYVDFIFEGVGVEEALEGVPPWLRAYVSIDRAAFLRDLELGGEIEVVDAGANGIWAFDQRV